MSCVIAYLTEFRMELSPFSAGCAQYKRTGRYEAHVWNSNTLAPSASGKRGRQLHLGSFSDGDRAAKCVFLHTTCHPSVRPSSCMTKDERLMFH